MTVEEAENICRPPIVGDYSLPPLTVEDVIFAAHRVKQKYGISCPKETAKLLNEIKINLDNQ